MTYQDPLGDIIKPGELESARALDCHRFLTSDVSEYFKLVDIRAQSNLDLLTVDVHVEVPQYPATSISEIERIVFSFLKNADSLPGVHPQRKEFPFDNLHVMVTLDDELPSLCLWEDAFDDLKLKLTPYMLFARTKEWLELAARGELHHADQPLEPVLLGGAGQVILPKLKDLDDSILAAYAHEARSNFLTLRFVRPDKENFDKVNPNFVLGKFITDPVVGRAVRYVPRNLQDLGNICAKYNLELSKKITEWITTVKTNAANLAKCVPVFVIVFPKIQSEDDVPEIFDAWAFVPNLTVDQLGEKTGTFYNQDGHVVPRIGPVQPDVDLTDVALDPFFVSQEQAIEDLPNLSGYGYTEQKKFTAIGSGALGSKVLELAVRSGFGKWVVIDKDVFMPHNVVRHILGNWAIASSKSFAVANFLNSIGPEEEIVHPIEGDILSQEDNGDLCPHLRDSDIIVDMSASVAVARYLGNKSSFVRCASLFLNPTGTDLVAFAEDKDRKITLSDLEATYYAFLAEQSSVSDHLKIGNGLQTRYGNGCRDLSVKISGNQVSILAGIASKQLRRCTQSDEASAMIWRSDEKTDEITRVEIPVCKYISFVAGDWELRLSSNVLLAMARLRSSDLPNETGGVLIGVTDYNSRKVFVCSLIEAPSDSKKRPHYFERGTNGLEAQLHSMSDGTLGQLSYIGEWHSHPDGVPAEPSGDDERVFSSLANLFNGTSEPHIMAIISEDGFYCKIGTSDGVSEHRYGFSPQEKGEFHARVA